MKKFCIFSGFLGAGKTTTMMALTKYYAEHYGKAAMISNDLGHGVNLADHRLAKLEGCSAAEITDDCICYKHEALAEKLDACFADGCELVISDIPGFGVGALEHVYHGMQEKFPKNLVLGPFTVLVEPATIFRLQKGEDRDLEFILKGQLEEADLIVLNKCDTIDEGQIADCREWLRGCYPDAGVILLSARTGEGMEELALNLRNQEASMRRISLDYGDDRFLRSMNSLSEYYIQYYASVCCNTFDGNAYLRGIANRVQRELQAKGADVPHLKLLAWDAEGDYGKADLIGVDRPVVESRRFKKGCTDLAVILNASAICEGAFFRDVMRETLEAVSDAYQLELMIFKEEFFDIGD